MSSASSAVTYTSVDTDSEPGRAFWGADEELSDGRPKHPPSPEYLPDPKHPPSPIDVPYIPELEYPEYLVPSDAEAPLEDQPLPVESSPTALSPGYVADSDPKEDPCALSLAVSSAILIVDPVSSAGDTVAFETDKSTPTPRSPQTKVPFAQTHLCRARKTVRLEPPMSASMEAGIVEHAIAPTPPLPLPSPLTTSPTDAGVPLGYRAVGIQMRAAAASPPLLLPSTSHRTDVPEAEMPPRKRACFTTPAPRFKIGESSAAGAARQPGPDLESDHRRYMVEQSGYGITDT
ncbi:hypothetical protein Tco_1148734 [Tanacetum coccineum]